MGKDPWRTALQKIQMSGTAAQGQSPAQGSPAAGVPVAQRPSSHSEDKNKQYFRFIAGEVKKVRSCSDVTAAVATAGSAYHIITRTETRRKMLNSQPCSNRHWNETQNLHSRCQRVIVGIPCHHYYCLHISGLMSLHLPTGSHLHTTSSRGTSAPSSFPVSWAYTL